MSNNQWNNGQADGQWQPQGQQDWNQAPQGSANEWNAPGEQQAADWNSGAQPQQSADWNPAASQQDWNQAQPQPSAQDWNTGAQPQTSAQDWNQAPQQGADWNAAPQGGQDWNQAQPPAQDWNQGQPPAQDWNQQPGGQPQWNQQPGGGFGAPGQQWQPAPQPGGNNAFGNVFDFSFKKLALPDASGTIFLIAVISIALWWLVDLVALISIGSANTAFVLQSVVGGLARTLIYILLARVLLEGANAVVKLAKKSDETPED